MFPSVPFVPASMASQELSNHNLNDYDYHGYHQYHYHNDKWLQPLYEATCITLDEQHWLDQCGFNAFYHDCECSIVTPVMTYGPLDSMANNWNYQLQEQEKHYFYQAHQFNVWNQALIESGNEIALLYNEVERVKMDQSRLEQELDIILFQQKELELMLTPIEQILKEQNGPLNMMYVNKEYEMIYRLAEIIDAELKRMSQDLKDIITYLNSLAHPADATEPLEQICKILNAHMESLQWITHNSVNSTFGVELKGCNKHYFKVGLLIVLQSHICLLSWQPLKLHQLELFWDHLQQNGQSIEGMMQKKVEEVAYAFEQFRRREQNAPKFAFE
ncbi:Nucleoporin 62 C-terminal-like [Apodemus speciosus]|uniref:Nucleoporin 62 C-terminal-like n=1 Tax=Apodemus speciosus TaxID=105296 RepID=A0ABQ0FV83_APOSI